MNRTTLAAVLALAAGVSAPAHAGAIRLNFDDLANNVAIDTFYDGGSDSSGAHGANFGVAFERVSSLNGKTTGYGFGSPPTVAVANGDDGSFINVAQGFTSLAFGYSFLEAGRVEIYSDLDRKTLLTAIDIGENFDPTFQTLTVNFTGVGRSIAFLGEPGTMAFDNLSLGVPEPATWSLMISGFGLTGAALRRRRRGGASAHAHTA